MNLGTFSIPLSPLCFLSSRDVTGQARTYSIHHHPVPIPGPRTKRDSTFDTQREKERGARRESGEEGIQQKGLGSYSGERREGRGIDLGGQMENPERMTDSETEHLTDWSEKG